MKTSISELIRGVLREGPATAREVAVELFDEPTQNQVQLMSAHLCNMKKLGIVAQLHQVDTVVQRGSKEFNGRRTWVWGMKREPYMTGLKEK